MKFPPLLLPLFLCLLSVAVRAQVPHLINYQGRVAVGAINFDGTGQFKFAMVNADGSTTYWSNDGTSTAGSEPTAAVSLPVAKGLYSVQLGDAALPHMTTIPSAVFANADVRLRVWFNDGASGFQLFTPDKRLAAVGYAIMAESVPDGSITGAKIAAGAITGPKIAAGAVDGSHLAASLTLGGTTSGTFSGGLTGNVAGNATNFTGPLAGDVTGAQGATVVSMVGGSTAASLHNTELTVGAATSSNDPGSLVKRDANGSFASGSLSLGGALTLPATTGLATGAIVQNGAALLQSMGTNNVFTGLGAGNFTLSGSGNTANGQNALAALTTGSNNLGLGFNAGNALTTGSNNIVIGNPGQSSENGTIRIGTPGTHANTYLAGLIHGDGSALTGISVQAANISGAINGSQIAAGAVGSIHLAAGSVGSTQISAGAVGSSQLAAGAAAANLASSGQAGVGGGGIVLSATNENAALVSAGYVKIGATLLNANSPVARKKHTVVSTGTSMIVWGGENLQGFPVNTGGVYTFANNSWTIIPRTGAPTSREDHTAIWTGSEMIIWGGGGGETPSGARYRPDTKTWTATSETNAPSGRIVHVAVWTGSEMIVWGGYNSSLGMLNTGGRYNPVTNVWTSTTTSGAPSARSDFAGVWTGTELIVWGGHDSGYFNTGGRYNPATNTWTATATAGAPTARAQCKAIWTGSEMIVWGGVDASGSKLNDGGRYNPASNSWTPITTSGAPSARTGFSIVWTGSQMIIWGEDRPTLTTWPTKDVLIQRQTHGRLQTRPMHRPHVRTIRPFGQALR